MSFILDALRKSENSRLRHDHPAVFSGRLAPIRHRLPTWSLVLIALLVLNFGVISFILLRDTFGQKVEGISPSSVTTAGAQTVDPFAPLPVPPALEPTPAPVTANEQTDPTPAAAPPMPSAIARDDLLARGASLPITDLNMHVYDANPQLRFVLLNGQRLREGESSREGLMVERITPEGVVLRFGANTFAVNLQ